MRKEYSLEFESYNRPTYKGDYKVSPKFEGPRFVWGTSGLGGVWGGVDEKESIETLIQILDSGNFAIDTAPSYFNAQEYLGKALKRSSEKLPFISTKVGRLRSKNPHEWIMDYSTEGMRSSFYQSLETMGVDKVNLVFLHEPQLAPEEELARITEVLCSFQKEGLVEMLGIGGNLVDSFLPYLEEGIYKVVSGFLRMNACNLDFFKSGENHTFKKYNLAYYNSSILHFGLLGSRIPTYKRNFEQEKGWLTRIDLENAEWLLDLANQCNMSLAEMAQRYAFSIGEADRIVLGGKNLSQFESTLKAISAGPLPLDLFDKITDHIIGSWLISDK